MMDSAEIEALSEEEAKNELRYALGVITAHDLVTERMENRIRALEAESASLREQLAEATKDSERLDWLEGNCKELPGDAARVSPYTFPTWDYKLHNWRMYHDDEGRDVEGDTLRVVLDAARAAEEEEENRDD